MPTQQQLYLTLPSNSQDFESNKTSNFRVRLPIPYELGGEWECGLAQIDYPHSFDNVTNDKTRIGVKENTFFTKFQIISPEDSTTSVKLLRGSVQKTEYISGGSNSAGLRLKFEIPRGSYDTIQGLVDAVNNSMKTHRFDAEEARKYNPKEDLEGLLKWFKTKNLKEGPPMFMVYDKNTRRVQINYKWGIKSVLFSPKLQYIFGIASERWVPISASGFVAEYPPDLTAGFNTLFIYCNLIEPQVVGNALSPLLRTVAIRGKQGDFISEVFQTPHYVKVKTKSFDVVELAIKNDTDEDVKFNFGKVIVKLHLRQIKS